MQTFFGYIRVSTVKQGTQGVSLQEQRASIEYYAGSKGFVVTEWLEERETAAKYGRPVFMDMMARLQRGEASGVIMHKIDRSARNLRDWVELSELADAGIAVHFSNEGVDLSSTMNRYSADIHAASAAHYIRNLREETLKGLYGRLKQGLYPWQAPIGYVDNGRGQVKTIDPIQGPLIRTTFEFYAQGTYNLKQLRKEMEALGLRNCRGGTVSLNGINRILRNSFYTGLIEVKVNGQTFKGIHEPLVTHSLFDRVQALLDGKTYARSIKHDFIFRKLLACADCGLSLIGECQKGRVYYRCHSPGCRTSVREDIIEANLKRELADMRLSEEEYAGVMTILREDGQTRQTQTEELVKSLELQVANAHDRLNRLTDAYVDGMIEKQDHSSRRSGLMKEIMRTEAQIAELLQNPSRNTERVAQFLEQAKTLDSSYIQALPHEKRQFLREATSNRTVSGKYVEFAWSNEFAALANRPKLDCCDHLRDRPRTFYEKIVKIFEGHKKEKRRTMSPTSPFFGIAA